MPKKKRFSNRSKISQVDESTKKIHIYDKRKSAAQDYDDSMSDD